MIDALNYAVRYAVKLGPHLKQIEENKERVYQLSKKKNKRKLTGNR